VICGDSISVNLFKLLAAGLALQPGRHRVVAVEGDFPADQYIAQGLQWLLGETRCRLDPVPRGAPERALGDDVALLMLSHVDFRSGRLEDMQALTRLAHRHGVLVVWDLAHSAGVVEVALEAALGVFEGIRVAELRAKSLARSDLFLDLVARDPALADFRLGTPPEHGRRGSQLSWHHPDAWPICRAWAERGVIGDFRAPDILRVGLSPLYLRYQDVFRAVQTLSDIVVSGAWRAPRFQQRARVT